MPAIGMTDGERHLLAALLGKRIATERAANGSPDKIAAIKNMESLWDRLVIPGCGTTTNRSKSMADVTAVISENTAIRYAAAMHSLESGAALLPYEMEALRTVAYAIREGIEANQLREKLAQNEEHDEP